MENNLTEPQLQAVERILAGEAFQSIADDLGIHINTLRKWRNKKEFVAELARQRQTLVKEAQSILSAAASHAARRLVEMMDDPNTTRNQLDAAKKVYDAAIQGGLIEFEDRLNNLEEALNERQV